MLLGHADISITAKVYAHLLDGDLKVRDDFRFDFDKSENSEDIINVARIDEKVAQILAQAISESTLQLPQAEGLLPAILERLSQFKLPVRKALAASSSEIHPDSTLSQKKPFHAPPMLHSPKDGGNVALLN